MGRLKAEVLAHPPPGYDDPAAAAAVAAGEVLAEVEAGEAAADTWDLVLDLEQGVRGGMGAGGCGGAIWGPTGPGGRGKGDNLGRERESGGLGRGKGGGAL